MIQNIMAVFVGGGVGATLRYMVSYVCKTVLQMPLVGTLAVNLVGCFLMGCMFGITADKIQTVPAVFRLLITVGFLGGLTTFSTFSLEGFELIKNGKFGVAAMYIVGSCVLGLLLVGAGYAVTRS